MTTTIEKYEYDIPDKGKPVLIQGQVYNLDGVEFEKDKFTLEVPDGSGKYFTPEELTEFIKKARRALAWYKKLFKSKCRVG